MAGAFLGVLLRGVVADGGHFGGVAGIGPHPVVLDLLEAVSSMSALPPVQGQRRNRIDRWRTHRIPSIQVRADPLAL